MRKSAGHGTKGEFNDARAAAPGGLSRRAFAASSLVGAVAAPGVISAMAHGAGSDRIRVGLVGCGGRGTGAASQAMKADPGVVIHALGDVFPERANDAAKRLSDQSPGQVDVPAERRFIGFDACRRVIDSGVDVVLLCTPPCFRPEQLEAAIAADKHVFAEKPMAVDAAGVRKVLAVAAEAKRKKLSLMSGFCWRYSSPERATFERILDGQIGEIRSVHTTYHASPLRKYPRQSSWSDMEWQLRNWWHFLWISGDHIVEQACHSVDKINWAMGGVMPVRATALGGRQAREGAESGNVYDHFAVVYEYENGARCFHTCRQMANCSYDNTDYIMGADGVCYVNGWGPTHVIEGRRPWEYEGPKPNMYQVEHNELFAAIRKGEPVNDGEYMANSTMMSILGRVAAYTGQTVTWDDAFNADDELSPTALEMGDVPISPVPIPGRTT